MKIYTKTGDDGSTGLLGGNRVPKISPRIEAIGDVDELNANLGVAVLHASGHLRADLLKIQNWLFDIGAELACPPEGKFALATLSFAHAGFLERAIDELTDGLPPLKAFILPGGTALAAELHRARAVCRRVERTICRISEQEAVRAEIRVFLNRLSDWLFVAARTANASGGVLDTEWQKSEAP